MLRTPGAIRPVVDEFTARQLERMRHRVVQAIGGAGASTEPVFLDAYTSAPPSAQAAVDIFSGEWSSELPQELHVSSGHVGLFADSRIETVISWLGGDLSGIRVLELGPLEGGHTYMLDRAGAEVFAIESNSRSFLKCLVVKELLSLERSRFARGDFVAYLAQTTERYDLVLASGVLYHMVDPVSLLESMAAASDRLAIWTHYFDEGIILNSSNARLFRADAEACPVAGGTYTLHPREYLEAVAWGGFCGGPETYARWMERQDILECLRRLGFDHVEISHEDPAHPNGPSLLLLARRDPRGREGKIAL